jgi:hypothetical protein
MSVKWTVRGEEPEITLAVKSTLGFETAPSPMKDSVCAVLEWLVNGSAEVTVGIIDHPGVVNTSGEDLVGGIGVISWVSVGIISRVVVGPGMGVSIGAGVGVSVMNCMGVSVKFGRIVDVGIVVRGVS